MGLLNSALSIGRSAILSYQGALQTIGNNISSVGSPDYTRLSPDLDPMQGAVIGRDLQPGAGVALTDIRRHVDNALEGRLRTGIGVTESANVERQALSQLEVLFTDLSDANVRQRLLSFLDGFDNLQNNPEDNAVRELTISNGALLAESLSTLRDQLVQLSRDFDGQIATTVAMADDITQKIAELNNEITRAEAGRQSQATGLRDQRDALLRDLSEIVDVTVREEPDGGINVYIGSEALVQGAVARGLIAVQQVDGEAVRTSVRFADTNQQIDLREGRLAGLIESRDKYGIAQIGTVDELAAVLIDAVNEVHASGQGLVGFNAVTGASDLLATDVALNSSAAGLAAPVQRGSFFITVADDTTGTPVAYRIDVDPDDETAPTTLESLVAQINTQVDGVTASITSDNRLSLQAADGFSFTFGHDGQTFREDTSGVVSALGLNTFFTGNNASDIAVNTVIVAQPALLAAASEYRTGDGTNAGRIAALDSVVQERLGGTSIVEFYDSLANSVAVASGAGRDRLEAASTILASLENQRQSISGVNLDEEAIALLKYERAFQGAARFVSTVQSMLDELVLLVR